MKRFIIFGIVFILVVFWEGWGFVFFVDRAKEKLIDETLKVFDQAIRKDKAQRGEGFLNIFTSKVRRTRVPSKSIKITTKEGITEMKKEKKNISYEEGKYINDHLYLLTKNPINVVRLDSIFKELLEEDDLPGETAIVYTANGVSECSVSDSVFYKEAIALELVSIGNFIKLQGYVKYRTWDIWRNVPHRWALIIIGLFVLMLVGGYTFFNWRKWKVFSQLKYIEKCSPSDKRIKENLFFNEITRELRYNENRISLTKRSAELLAYLFKGEDWFQTYEDIKKDVWGNGDTSNDAVRNAVNRLNNELEGSGLYVEKLTKKGLRIINKQEHQTKINRGGEGDVLNYQNDTILSGKSD